MISCSDEHGVIETGRLANAAILKKVKRIIIKMLLYHGMFDYGKNLRVIEEAINSTMNQSTNESPNEIGKR